MERTMNFSTSELATLRPGLDRMRKKICLAHAENNARGGHHVWLSGIMLRSQRYYGEENQAIGHFLYYILTRSDNVKLFAWTRRSGSRRSYPPGDLTVYNQIVLPHVPPSIETTEVGGMVTALRSSFPASLAVALYERLIRSVSLTRLPGVVFPLTDHVAVSNLQP
ncbi:hypothetical protein EV363DRAFT_1323277 [Boletus edulis]|nr:hypothetical protein EV363DRAFT_1323277 [Boletus edulis]